VSIVANRVRRERFNEHLAPHSLPFALDPRTEPAASWRRGASVVHEVTHVLASQQRYLPNRVDPSTINDSTEVAEFRSAVKEELLWSETSAKRNGTVHTKTSEATPSQLPSQCSAIALVAFPQLPLGGALWTWCRGPASEKTSGGGESGGQHERRATVHALAEPSDEKP
jgi:hypothetical protein